MANPTSKNELIQSSLAKALRDPTYGTLKHLCEHAFNSAEEFMVYIKLLAKRDERFGIFFRLWENDRIHHSLQRGRSYRQHSLDKLAHQAGLDSLEVKIELVRFCHEFTAEHAAIMSDLAHPHIVKRNIKEALKPGGVKDRELHFWRRGELPGKGGVSVNVSATAIAAAQAETTPLPNFEEQTISGSKVVREIVVEPSKE